MFFFDLLYVGKAVGAEPVFIGRDRILLVFVTEELQSAAIVGEPGILGIANCDDPCVKCFNDLHLGILSVCCVATYLYGNEPLHNSVANAIAMHLVHGSARVLQSKQGSILDGCKDDRYLGDHVRRVVGHIHDVVLEIG